MIHLCGPRDPRGPLPRRSGPKPPAGAADAGTVTSGPRHPVVGRAAGPAPGRAPDPDPVGPGRLHGAAAAAIGAALAVAFLVPIASPVAAVLVAGAAGMTIFAAIVPPGLASLPRRRHRRAHAVLDAAERFLASSDRRELPDPDREDDAFVRRLATAVDELGRLALATGRRNRYLHRSLEQEVATRTRRATQALQREASTDPLTGLGNRRRLEEALGELFSEAARRRDDTVAAILIDLDRFKQVNDVLGHAAGDECLRFVGELLASTLRGEDVAVRLGGDEFVVLLPGLAEAQAASVARRIAELHRQRPWTHAAVPAPTLSLGVAAVHRSREDGAEILLERADAAVYLVKGRGRDAVAAWSERQRPAA